MNRLELLLVILSEECAELAKECSKALRFGLDDFEPGTTVNNRDRIINEFNDLYAMIQMLVNDGILDNNLIGDSKSIKKKISKVETYLNYSKNAGTLNDSKINHIESGEKEIFKNNEHGTRLKFLTLPFRVRKNIGNEMIPNSFDNIQVSENQRSIDFLLEIKNSDRYDELWDKMKTQV